MIDPEAKDIVSVQHWTVIFPGRYVLGSSYPTGDEAAKNFSLKNGGALTGMAQLVELHPTKRKFTGSIPSQGTHLSCGFSNRSGCIQEETDECFSLTLMFLSLSFSLLSPLSKNK